MKSSLSADEVLYDLKFHVKDTLDGGILEERFLWSWGEGKRRALLNVLSHLENDGLITRKTTTTIRLTPRGWKKLDNSDAKDGS